MNTTRNALRKVAAHPSRSFLLVCLLHTAFWLPLHAATVTWVGSSGDWNTATNWNTGALPGIGDDVVIGPGPAITLSYSSGASTVNSIQSQQPFVLSGGVLSVSSFFQAGSTIRLAGGTLQSASVVVSNGASLVVNGAGTLDGVTFCGDEAVPAPFWNALQVELDAALDFRNELELPPDKPGRKH